LRPPRDLDALLSAAVDRNPDTDPHELATRVVDRMPAALRRQTLIRLLVDEIDMLRRVKAHRIEEQARRLAESAAPATQPEPEPPPPPNHRPEDFQRLYDDPTLWHGEPGGILRVETHWPPPQGYSWVGPYTSTDTVPWNDTSREQFRDWCETSHGAGAFQAWLDRGILLEAEEPDGMELWEQDWVPQYLCDQAKNSAFFHEMTGILQKFADEIRFEVTTELLNTVFATGDGTRVTWRDASVLQHEARIDMLTAMITGTSQTAAMHIAAVRMIKDAGVETLGQLTDPDGGSSDANLGGG
jgi:hypothetical protein